MNSKKILVQKFGGTSVGSTERIKAVADICINSKKTENCGLVVVVSAMGHTTDELVSKMNEITESPSKREIDMLLSTGEQISISLLAMALQEKGHKAVSLTGWQAGFKTSPDHFRARVLDINTNRLKKLLEEDNIVIVAGFQGLTEEGEITTLGRGGSDTSAVALAVALNADRCDIYTDVDGIHTSDPRLVEKTSKLKYITYDEMLELATLGAQVLHPRSVEIAKKFNVRLRVRSSWKTDDPGTLVLENLESLKNLEGEKTMIEGNSSIVRGVALDQEQARLSIIGVPDRPGIANRIFSELARRGVSVDLIVQSVSHENLAEVDFTVKRSETKEAKNILEEICKELGGRQVSVDENVVKVSIVGAGMIGEPGIAAKMFDALGSNGINIQIISTGEIHISCIIEQSRAKDAVRLIHEAFKLDSVCC